MATRNSVRGTLSIPILMAKCQEQQSNARRRKRLPPITGVNADHSLANLSCSIEGEVKKKYVSDRWSLSCFQPHLLEQGRF